MVNVHFSLLPRWRGAAPVERALLAGDDVTGVCIMAVEEGLDTGRRLRLRARCRSAPTTTADELRAELVDVGTELLVDVLAGPLPAARAAGRRADVRRQDRRRTSCELDWARPAVELDRLVRVGGAWTTFRGRRLKVARGRAVRRATARGEPGDRSATDGARSAAGRRRRCGSSTVQPEGKAPMAWRRLRQRRPPDARASALGVRR